MSHLDARVLGAPPALCGGGHVGNLTAVFTPQHRMSGDVSLYRLRSRRDPAKHTETKRVPPGRVQAPAPTRQPGPGELPPGADDSGPPTAAVSTSPQDDGDGLRVAPGRTPDRCPEADTRKALTRAPLVAMIGDNSVLDGGKRY